MSFDAMARAMEIAADRGSGAPFVIYNDLPDLEAAYRVQSALSRVEGGVGGYKIAWNSPALMAAHGVSAPAAARVRRALIRPDGAQVSADEFVTPMLEPEIAIVLGEDMPEGPHDADSVVRYVRRMVPAFELLDRREAKERHAPSIIASPRRLRLFKSKSYEFKLWGRYALFTDPVTKTGGEKCSYHIPTYEALKGVAKSIYWKPTFIWVIDEVRIMNPIRTQTKGTKPLVYSGGNTLAIYTFLAQVEYQVKAHFEWNLQRPELSADRNIKKHEAMAERALKRGGRQDIFLGTRDCQGYVEPCTFGTDDSHYAAIDELGFGLMFHGFDYPDETGDKQLHARFWRPVMRHGIIQFDRPETCENRRFIRNMEPKKFELDANVTELSEQDIKA